MKLLLFTLLAAVLLAFPLTTNADGQINVMVDGHYIIFENQPPLNIDGRILVPVRGVFESLGFTPTWDSATRTATLTRHDFTIVITIDSNVFTTNGTRFYLDVPAQIIGGSTMLPIRFVLESVGYDLTWDSAANTVQISTDNPTPPDLPQYVTRNEGVVLSPDAPLEVPPATSADSDVFLDFISTLTHQIIGGYTTDVDRLRAIYSFIVLNFNYLGGRDGAVADGSARPTNVPQTNIFRRSGGMLELVNLPPDITFNDIANRTAEGARFFNIISAWELLIYGDGVCDNFAALMMLMAQSLGMEARTMGGFYVNRDGTRLPHAWVAIRLNGRWYFFDPQIEASNLTRRTENRTNIPFYWFMQYENDPLTQGRYVYG